MLESGVNLTFMQNSSGNRTIKDRAKTKWYTDRARLYKLGVKHFNEQNG